MFQPIEENVSVYKKVVAQIQEMIMHGELKKGGATGAQAGDQCAGSAGDYPQPSGRRQLYYGGHGRGDQSAGNAVLLKKRQDG